MGKTGRLYSPEFKEEVVRLVRSCDAKYPVAKIARDLDVGAETLRNWVNQAEIDAGEREEHTTFVIKDANPMGLLANVEADPEPHRPCTSSWSPSLSLPASS